MYSQANGKPSPWRVSFFYFFRSLTSAAAPRIHLFYGSRTTYPTADTYILK
ncbi:hypothetical protein TSAR_000854 [Trichomalopsis sarcophagae]|uniref:Uncharacterized protein n=1 Tax=Trichomalopsis sarcophagae TaxID=543379 RepID=A0A232EME0_9HYME|nr:hypothetical protein TSAR_000854 [Trichomalopsis sarcophagae]